MNKTKIEWVDYTINPVKGLCPMACPYCYARRMYKRFKWNPEIRFEPETLIDLQTIRSGSRVFIGSTMELFHETIRPDWLDYIFWVLEKRPDVTCIFLTKEPQNLIKFNPFPDNCWVGVTTTNADMFFKAYHCLKEVKAKVKYISIEPLLGKMIWGHLLSAFDDIVDWLIIGAQTPYSPKTAPKIEWVQEIVEAADKAGIPVFLKNNLRPLFKDRTYPQWARNKQDTRYLRQEFPKEFTECRK